MDITDLVQLRKYFKDKSPDFCINAAAYTNVDKAEIEQYLNNKINITGVSNLAIACRETKAKLVHISSDYVYNNNSGKVMTELSGTFPAGVYAKSKLEGEKEVIKQLDEYFIIRTSWLYSEFGHNFVKTMIKLSKERHELGVVNDQIGSPTYATDLANTILTIINSKNHIFGIFNYSNCGFISWYDFAKKIIELYGSDCKIVPILSKDYPTPAPRPFNSRLSKEKIKSKYGIKIPDWEVSLQKCLSKIQFKD